MKNVRLYSVRKSYWVDWQNGLINFNFACSLETAICFKIINVDDINESFNRGGIKNV